MASDADPTDRHPARRRDRLPDVAPLVARIARLATGAPERGRQRSRDDADGLEPEGCRTAMRFAHPLRKHSPHAHGAPAMSFAETPRESLQSRRARRLPGATLGGGPAVSPDRAAGARRRRQGRPHPQGDHRLQPAGHAGRPASACRPRRSCATTTCGASMRRRPARGASASSTAPTTRMCWSCGSTSSSPKDRVGRSATTRSTPSRRTWPRTARGS